MNQCHQCRKEKWAWEACPFVPQWFSPADIQKYCPNQVRWILANLAMLRKGYWPPEGVATGYYDTGGKKYRRGGAYFEVPVCVAIDIELRLVKCGKDGILARQCLSEGWDAVTLAELMGKPVYIIQSKIRRVVNYCSGVRPKQLTYDEFNRRRGIAANFKGG